MSSRTARITWFGQAVAFGIAVVMAMAVPALAGERRAPVQFSAPRSGIVASNLHELNSPSNFRGLGPGVFDSSLNPGNSLGPVVESPVNPLRVPTTTVTPNKRSRKQEEQRRDWLFVRPEERDRAPTMEELFNIPDYARENSGEEKKSVMESYYESLGRRQGGASNRFDKVDDPRTVEEELNGGKKRSPEPAATGFDAFTRTDSSINGIPNDNGFAPALGVAPAFPGTTGIGGGFPASDPWTAEPWKSGFTRTEEANPAQKDRMDAFKKILSPTTMGPSFQDLLKPAQAGVDVPGSSSTSPGVAPPGAGRGLIADSVRRDVNDPFRGSFDRSPAFVSEAIQDPNVGVFGEPPKPVSLQPPPKAPYAPPVLVIPRRKL